MQCNGCHGEDEKEGKRDRNRWEVHLNGTLRQDCIFFSYQGMLCMHTVQTCATLLDSRINMQHLTEKMSKSLACIFGFDMITSLIFSSIACFLALILSWLDIQRTLVFLFVANFSFLTYTVICGVRPAAWQLYLPQLHCPVSFLMKKI